MIIFTRKRENNGGTAPKRAKLVNQQQENAPVSRNVAVAIQPMNPIAVQWQRDGCPGKNFLQLLGLGCLANINWTLPDPEMPSKLGEFLRSYDTLTGKSTVDGRVIKLSPKRISNLLGLPNHGSREALKKKTPVEALDPLKLFKPGAYSLGRGFVNEMARDPSKARVFSLISEVILLKSGPSVKCTGAVFLEAISQAIEGTTVNWADCICKKVRSAVDEVKEKISCDQPGASLRIPMSACIWISLFINASSLQDQPEINSTNSSEYTLQASSDHEVEELQEVIASSRGASTSQNIDIVSGAPEKSPQETLVEASMDSSAKLLSVVGMLSTSVQTLTQKLREAEEKLVEKETMIETLQKKLRDAEANVGELRRDNNTLGIMVVNNRKALDASEEMVSRSRRRVEELEEKLYQVEAGASAEQMIKARRRARWAYFQEVGWDQHKEQEDS